MSRVFLTSDLHLGHTNILKFGSRPHDTVEDMFDVIKEDWNQTVNKKDIVWVLGDIAWSTDWAARYAELPGRKRLVMGNHDNKIPYELLQRIFEKVCGAVRYKQCILTHIPIHPEQFFGWKANIHGHIHNKEQCLKDKRYINVNVDVRDTYRPIPLEQLMEELK